jgi:hypothetical protein
MFNQFGDLERCTLRPANVHSVGREEYVQMPGKMTKLILGPPFRAPHTRVYLAAAIRG